MRQYSTILALLVSVALTAPTLAFADDPMTDQDRDRDRVHQEDFDQLQTHLRKKLKLSDSDLTALRPRLKRYLRLRGEQAHIRLMLKTGLETGCQGPCLQEMVQATNRAMVWGMQDVEATATVQDCLQDQIRDRDRTGAKWTDKDLADQLHDRVRDRLRIWERDHDRERQQEQEREMERERQRESDRAAERTGAMKNRGDGR